MDKRKVLLFLLIAVLVRIVLYLNIPPITTADTIGYVDLAAHLRSLDMSGYGGERTPVYPLLMVLGNMNFHAVMILQLLLGIAISFALYGIVWRLTFKPWLSFLGGLTYAVYWPYMYVETWMMTETTSTALLVFTFLFMVMYVTRDTEKSSGIIYLVGVAICAALTALTRPIYLIVAPIFAASLLFEHVAGARMPWQSVLKRMSIVLLPVVVFTGSWSYLNYRLTNIFGPTTLVGYNLSRVVGGFMEDAPEKDALLRDIYLKYRQLEVARNGTYLETIWTAIPEMQRKTGLNYGQLSKRLEAVCIDLIKKEPGKYMRQVVIFWGDFWYRQGLDLPFGEQTSPVLHRIAVMYDRVVYTLFEAVFLMFPFAYFGFRTVRKRIAFSRPQSAFLLLAYGVTVLACIAIGFIEFAGARYSVPTRPIMSIAVVIILSQVTHTPLFERIPMADRTRGHEPHAS